MKSILYRKHRASKYKFPTRIIKGSGTKGKLVIGSALALTSIEARLGRKLQITKTNHTRTEWVFYERRTP
jgi:hypothetical protein